MTRRVGATLAVFVLVVLAVVATAAGAHTEDGCDRIRVLVADAHAVLDAAGQRQDRAERRFVEDYRAILDAAAEACAPVPTTTTTAAPPTTAAPTTTTTTTTAPVPPPPPSGVLDLPRVPWEGGPAYWAQFPKAAASGMADPSFFPLSVFLGKPSHADELKAVGINMYQGAEHDGSLISDITDTGMLVMIHDEWTRAEVGDDPRVVGWHVGDECDMGFCGGNNAQEVLQLFTENVNRHRAYNDGRFIQANFGNGILSTFWAVDTFDDLMQLTDVASVDKYMYTSPHVWDIVDGVHDAPYWPNGTPVPRSYAYGWLADEMTRFGNPADLHPNWVFVETARPYLGEAGALTITPEQLEGAVWSAIIHEARGIAYFQHNNDYSLSPPCGTYSLVECDPARLAKITATNAKVKSLAPVINTQSYVWDFGPGSDTMLKVHDGSAYIFAGVGMGETPGSKTFTLPSGVTGTSVEVVGEGRTLPVTDGVFVDDFAAEYTHHVYRIAL